MSARTTCAIPTEVMVIEQKKKKNTQRNLNYRCKAVTTSKKVAVVASHAPCFGREQTLLFVFC